MKFKSAFLQELSERGYLYQNTNNAALDTIICETKIAAYVGFDCTAISFHVGNLLQIMLMRKLQQHGHQPIILLGGATTKIGDPSDKQGLRKMLSDDEIKINKEQLVKTFSKFLDFNCINKPIIVDNIDWFKSITYLDFLRDYGKLFSINRMLTFDSVKNRLDRQSHLTFLEFNYMLLQAYDFVELYKQHKCILQFGGSEQWGNIVSGIDLGRKMLDVELFGITTPLITNSSGTKMGKTADGAIWLNAELLSPYDYWQFWRNTNDADVIKFLKIYTEIPVDQINNMANNDINELKKILADHATTLCHGSSAADMARQQSEAIFEQSDINSMATYELIGDEMLYDILVKLNCASSNSAAKRLISGKAIKINNITIVDEKHIINKTGNEYILTISKKKYFKLI